MPTYEYECTACNHRFDFFQNIKEEPLKTCVQCGGPVKRLIGTGSGIIFKGSGFYCTDFKDKKGASAETKGSSTAAPTKKTEKSEADTKSSNTATDKPNKATEKPNTTVK